MARIVGSTILLVLPLACRSEPSNPEQGSAGQVAVDAKQAEQAEQARKAVPESATATSYPCSGYNTLTFGSTVPPDFTQVSSDLDADCFGWQEFISLNWPADSTSGFVEPGDTEAVAWQGYMSSQQLFQPDGSPPPPWGTQPTITEVCLTEAGLDSADASARTALTMTTKFSSEFESSDGQQAAPRNAPAWLGDVDGNNVWYEVRVNENEYDEIVSKTFYNREGQQAWYANASNPSIALPMGSFSPSQIGAMEVKAAWIEVEDPSVDKWNRYKLTRAVIVDPTTQKCRAVTVALVGLHIIHKTQQQPTWVWATFEHVDNAPDQAEAVTTTKTWNFFDPNCRPKPVTVSSKSCQYEGQTKITIGCDQSAWNQPPQYWLGDGCPDPQPIQVTRRFPIDANAVAANQAAWKAMDDAGYSSSVWKSYELVNVQWSTNPPTSQPRSVPQTFQSPQPDSHVANTVLETYAQDTKCVDCHQYATISGSDALPSDFSFLLQDAQPIASAKLLRSSPRPKARRVIR
jgi:hypothetical protein